MTGSVHNAHSKHMLYLKDSSHSTIQYNNGIYRAPFTKHPGALTQLAVICSAKFLDDA